MGDNDNLAIGLIIITLLVFIIVVIIFLYYAYSGQSGDTSDDDDTTIEPGDNIDDLINNLKSKDVSLPTTKKVKNKHKQNKVFNKTPNKTPSNKSDVSKNNIKQLGIIIKDGLTTIDSNIREPFNFAGRKSRVNKIEDVDDDSFNRRVATRVNSDLTLSDSTRNGKLFIIESTKSITLKLPKNEGITLKFWNNTLCTHILKSDNSILDENSGGREFTINPGQFVILESLDNLWLVITKTKSGEKISPTKPCHEDPNEECDMTGSINGEIKDLLNGEWLY